ncbi:MAG: hypothetical protein NUW37_01355 [Planctomycetes bacterium]|nr:hypothetical protein [Planctomycetota bacterium]
MFFLSMVQIDVPLAFCLGATLALIARDVLLSEPKVFANPFVFRGLFVCSLTIVPVGVFYLWSFPHWDTMYMFEPSYANPFGPAAGIPATLVLGFVPALMLLSLAGFTLTHRLILRGGLFVPILVPCLVFAGVCAFCYAMSERMLYVGTYAEFAAGQRYTPDETWVLWNLAGIITAIVMVVGVGAWAIYIRILVARARSGAGE